MKTYTVRSGGHTWKGRAVNSWEAAKKAVASGKFETLGWLISVDAKGEETKFSSSERVCKALGVWSDA